MTDETYTPTPAYAPVTLETERAQLARLNYLGGQDPRRSTDDRCQACGLHPADPLLCSGCEARRQRLAAKFPDVPALKPFADIVAAQRDQEPDPYQKQPTFDVGPVEERLPYADD